MSTKSINLNIELKSEEDIEKFLDAIEKSKEYVEKIKVKELHTIKERLDKGILEAKVKGLNIDHIEISSRQFGQFKREIYDFSPHTHQIGCMRYLDFPIIPIEEISFSIDNKPIRIVCNTKIIKGDNTNYEIKEFIEC